MTRDEALNVLRGAAEIQDELDITLAMMEAIVLLERLSSPRMGAKDIAEGLGVKVPNLKHVKIEPHERISGGAIPVYLSADYEAEKERRVQRAMASE